MPREYIIIWFFSSHNLIYGSSSELITKVIFAVATEKRNFENPVAASRESTDLSEENSISELFAIKDDCLVPTKR